MNALNAMELFSLKWPLFCELHLEEVNKAVPTTGNRESDVIEHAGV